MRALYPVVGAGAVDVCLRAPEAAPCGFGRHGCGPMLFPVFGTKGCASLLQCMCYFQVVEIAIRSGLLLE